MYTKKCSNEKFGPLLKGLSRTTPTFLKADIWTKISCAAFISFGKRKITNVAPRMRKFSIKSSTRYLLMVNYVSFLEK